MGRKVALIAVLVAGCAGSAAERPLAVRLGLDRATTARELKRIEYCAGDAPAMAREEVYPRCSRPGTDYSESWIWVRFDGDRLVSLRRWERFPDPERAVERWNDLVAGRKQLAPDSFEARDAVRAASPLLPAGTRSWAAFRIDDQNVVGVYLLDPTPPENANVLEEVIAAPKQP